MSKITYEDKVAISVDPSVEEINKITDANMNEIKSVVNGNDTVVTLLNTKVTTIDDSVKQLQTYSTTEQNTGKKWIDGKYIYRKVYNITGSYTSDTIIDASFTSNYVDSLVSVEGGFVSSSGTLFPATFIRQSSNQFAGVFIGSGGLTITITGTTVAKVKLVIEYTKK